LKVVGNDAKVAAFHFVMGILDPDYPWAPAQMRRSPSANLLCPVCNALIYYLPSLTPQEIKALAKQINDNTQIAGHLKVKVMMFNVKCPGEAVTPIAQLTASACHGAD
jgi:hypothetical protein